MKTLKVVKYKLGFWSSSYFCRLFLCLWGGLEKTDYSALPLCFDQNCNIKLCWNYLPRIVTQAMFFSLKLPNCGLIYIVYYYALVSLESQEANIEPSQAIGTSESPSWPAKHLARLPQMYVLYICFVVLIFSNLGTAFPSLFVNTVKHPLFLSLFL